MKVILLLLLLSVGALAWDAPKGIPAPDWGGTTGNPIELARPAFPDPWTSNTAGFYYVEVGGTNVGNGYPGDPKGSIPSNPGAGSVIVLNGSFGARTFDLRGDASNLVWITSYDTETPAEFTGKITMSATNTYAVIDNIACDMLGSGNGKFEIAAGVDHICFRSITYSGVAPANGSSTSADGSENQSGWAFLAPASDFDTNNIIIYGCTVTNTGNLNYVSGDPDAHCISMGVYVEDVWIVDNTFSYTSGNAVQVGAGTTNGTVDSVACRRIYMGRNTAHHIAQAGFWAKRSDVVIMSENVCYTLRRDTPSNPNSGGFGGQYGPKNLWIINNTVHDCENGVTIQANSFTPDGTHTVTPVYIVGNVFYDIHDETGSDSDWINNRDSTGGVCVTIRGAANAYIANNTFYDYDAGIEDGTSNETHIYGNAFIGRAEALGIEIGTNADPSSQNTVEYNAFESTVWVKVGAPAAYTSLSAINSAKGPDNITSTAPTFTNAAGGNFAIGSGSDLRDAGGTGSGVFSTFSGTYSLSIAYDRNGTARPQGGTWDIGAYEAVQLGGLTTGSLNITGTLNVGP